MIVYAINDTLVVAINIEGSFAAECEWVHLEVLVDKSKDCGHTICFCKTGVNFVMRPGDVTFPTP